MNEGYIRGVVCAFGTTTDAMAEAQEMAEAEDWEEEIYREESRESTDDQRLKRKETEHGEARE